MKTLKLACVMPGDPLPVCNDFIVPAGDTLSVMKDDDVTVYSHVFTDTYRVVLVHMEVVDEDERVPA